ncbi:ABC transporter permease [Nitratireductor aquimarinus]|uniref:ABC transporter permease n=1 Tax=Nitratireductor aquimarinus TaxID=889300 RepID=A0ABU4ALX2_9HYPH|nr:MULTISPECIES: ABC transporter permease [Alphaproteobacteria]MBY6023362.1 ABC transporter permease [Nitratireductor sp. DP7N14-4]MBN7758568.1 ABC transporter permease [Nitratireductor aquimarinus]MBY6001330.1 ABC transporter permease [Tritonibacter mobilis]MCV0381452.1 ABC transporter permease [Nitratireductor sp.]MDV6227248.1 ABC transporter permease [Nitratireductor aquimarinus]
MTDKETVDPEVLIALAENERKTLIERTPQWLLVLLFGAAVVTVWHMAVTYSGISQLVLPGPYQVLQDLIFTLNNLFTGGYVAHATWITLVEVVFGFLLASAIGLTLGMIIGATTLGRKAIMPYVVAINTMPKVAFAPLFVAWFGFGIESKIMMAAFISFFPVTINTAAGLAATDSNMSMLFKSLEANRWQTLIKLQMPYATPYIFAGLKLAAVWSVIGVVVGEYMGGGEGLGELVRVAASQLRVGRVFAQILLLSLMGLSVFGFVTLLERYFVRWRR